MSFNRFVMGLLVIGFFLAPVSLRAQREKLPPADLEHVEKTWPGAKKTYTGVRYVILKSGTGETAKKGHEVAVTYSGRLLNGKVFDENLDAASPLRFRAGRETVVDGFDEIVQLMREGDKWIVIIPPELAYGTRGRPPSIPRNATLVFELELLSIKRD